MGKWKARHRQDTVTLGSGGYGPLPIITAVCEQDLLLHVCSALHFATLV